MTNRIQNQFTPVQNTPIMMMMMMMTDNDNGDGDNNNNGDDFLMCYFSKLEHMS